MGEAGGGHQIRNANAIVAALPKQPGRRLDHVLPVGLCLCLGDLHFLTTVGSCLRRLHHTLMSVIIKTLTI